jgi:hypothetical protein
MPVACATAAAIQRTRPLPSVCRHPRPEKQGRGSTPSRRPGLEAQAAMRAWLKRAMWGQGPTGG